ncbi:MAG: hypothetical protein ACI8TQ_000777 [Planctomycetota bacterium]|jgi:hypothetical protein
MKAGTEQIARNHGRYVYLALALLTILGLAVRLTGLGHGLPHAPEPDAFLLDQVRLHHSGSIENRIDSDNYGKYPHLLSRLFALAPEPERAPQTLDEELEQAAQPFLFGRLIVALLSVCLIPLTFFLARHFLSPWWAFTAAAFITTSLLHHSFSQQARPHGPLATFTVLGVLSLFALLRRPTLKRYLWAGIACGLAVACLHNGAAILIPALLAHLLATRNQNLKSHLRALLPLAPIFLLLLLCYPFLFPDLRAHLPFVAVDQTGLLPTFPHAASNHWSDWVHGQGFGLMIEYLWSFDPALLVLFVGGIFVSIRSIRPTLDDGQRRLDLFVAAGYVLPYVLVLGAFDRTYERFLLPLLPFVACFAAQALSALTGTLPTNKRHQFGPAFVMIALAFPALVVTRSALQRTQPDPASELAAWIQTELDPQVDRLIATPIASYPLPFELKGDSARRELGNHAKLPWPRFQSRVTRSDRNVFEITPMALLPAEQPNAISMRDSRADLRRRIQTSGCNWVVLRVRPGRAMYEVFVAVLSKLGTRVARFTAREDEHVREDRGTDRALQVLRNDIHGPSHDVYRLDRLKPAGEVQKR